ncbi:hypothetical protein J6590_019741 [Homalodisca vitripennis]|nr:hypothetical protein J6590_019741 [Homalodisca vitripennis]
MIRSVYVPAVNLQRVAGAHAQWLRCGVRLRLARRATPRRAAINRRNKHYLYAVDKWGRDPSIVAGTCSRSPHTQLSLGCLLSTSFVVVAVLGRHRRLITGAFPSHDERATVLAAEYVGTKMDCPIRQWLRKTALRNSTVQSRRRDATFSRETVTTLKWPCTDKLTKPSDKISLIVVICHPLHPRPRRLSSPIVFSLKP